MTVPAQGVERLMHFIALRRGALRMSAAEAKARGLPTPKTLRDAASGGSHLRVRTLRRIDDVLGWEPGSAAATLVGASPLSVQASPTSPRRRTIATGPDEVLARTLDVIAADLRRACEAVSEANHRLAAAAQSYSSLCAELTPQTTGASEADE